MISTRAFGISVLALVVSTSPLHGQTTGQYRDFQLGCDLATVASLTGVAASDATVIHSRPAMLQELQWHRPYTGTQTPVDPVEQIVFSFYNDQLFRLFIDYGRDQTEGMTDADMVEAISTMYGSTVKAPLKSARAPLATAEEQPGTRVAAWGNSAFTAVLYRSSGSLYGSSSFRMVVSSVRLSALARTADAQAVRLDERDAPQRERAREKKEADDALAAKAKARLANKAAFKP